MNTLELLRAGKLAGIQRLTLACGLTDFPREIFDLADTLEILDLSNNSLNSLPDDLPRLKKLRVLFCSNNAFTELPAVLGQCTQLSMVGFKANQIRSVPGAALPATLRWLILTDNQIDVLPGDIGHCTHMQKLMLAGNQLRTLPGEMAACSQLELLRISANRLTHLPDFLLTLPKLSWLAYAGNPFCESREKSAVTNTPIAGIDWHRLQLQHQLGEGASGVIYQAHCQNQEGMQAVAVKLFKGDVTSDGLPRCEMAASICAGVHPHLIPILGKVVGHPEALNGMVMSLIDSGFGNLAAPPSLDSCTRDIYTPETTFELNTALRIALGIASAACHLHAQGLMHGDLYAHNILHNGDGHALLGDFGAASLVSGDDPQHALALQGLEVRAFGCLLEELIEHGAPTADAGQTWQSLAILKEACLQKTVRARPSFEELERSLMRLV